jgi:peptide/nickel transport system permease protein
MPRSAFVEQLRKDFGLDRPFLEQLLVYTGKVIQGNRGYSFRHRQSVFWLIMEKLPGTLLLMAAAMVWALVGGVTCGVLAAHKAGTWVGAMISVVSLVAYATQVLWLGLMLIVVFTVKLQWLPTYGMSIIAGEAVGLRYVIDVLWHLMLPTVTLGLFYLALYTRLTRASMLEVLGQDFILVARAKGLSEQRVIYQHALRNAVLGVTTMAGMQIGQIVGGSVVVETIFAWPGMGRLLFEAVFQRDYPVLLGILAISSTVVIVMNMVTDVIYGILDSRIRYS